MFDVLRRVTWVVSLAGAVAACSPASLELPDGVRCASTVSAGPNENDVRDALSRATSGSCVIAAAGKYALTYDVPAGVAFGGAPGTVVELSGSTSDTAAIRLGAGATLSGVVVRSAANVGVSIDSAGVKLQSVTISGARVAGLVSWCEDDCRVADVTELRDVELTGNGVGLLAHGAHVKTFGGRIASSQSVSLASGYGVVASHGATLEMTDTAVEDNEELGVLVDGRNGTSAALTNVGVRNNRGRGLWAQSLEGSLAAPKLQLTRCPIEGNALVGLGARASRGIQVNGGRVAATRVGLAATATPGVFADVGDGLGLFDTTGDVLVDGLALDNNERSQVLVDQGAAGVTVQNATLTSQGAQLGVVVQRTSASVQAPDIVRPMTGQELPISAPALAVPTR
ncbi:MAG: hypothetical protein JNG84_04075 [Archangium sp.]|nr:hypothetical protein [Archangium sp.]